MRHGPAPIQFVNVNGRMCGSSQAANDLFPQPTGLGKQVWLKNVVKRHDQAVGSPQPLQEPGEQQQFTRPRKGPRLVMHVNDIRPHSADDLQGSQHGQQRIPAGNRVNARVGLVRGSRLGRYKTRQPVRRQTFRQPHDMVADAADTRRILTCDKENPLDRTHDRARG